MTRVLLLACLLALAHQIAAQCNSIQTVDYGDTLNPACSPNDLYIMWPNYENFQTYYKCQSIGNAVLATCPAGTYFCFVYQECVSCGMWIPPVHCSQLRTQNPPNCVPMGQGGNYPTAGPTASPTASPTAAPTAAPITPEPTVPTNATALPTELPTVTPTLPPSQGTPVTNVPLPPSPSTDSPVPMPPTPAPTPPSVSVNPPIISPDEPPMI